MRPSATRNRTICAEVVQDENAVTPYEQLEEKTVTGMLQDMVQTLDPREATIPCAIVSLASTGDPSARWRKWERNLESPASAFGRSKTSPSANSGR